MFDPWDEGLPEDDDDDDEDRKPRTSNPRRPRGECAPDLATGVLLSDLFRSDNPDDPNPAPTVIRLNG